MFTLGDTEGAMGSDNTPKLYISKKTKNVVIKLPSGEYFDLGR